MFCSRPFEWLEVLFNNDVYMCCPVRLPKVIGNIKEQPVAQIWNSETAQELRQSILDGSFRYCKNCPYLLNMNGPVSETPRTPRLMEIVEKQLTVLEDGPKWLNLSNDLSCNLSCPSCRQSVIHIHGKEFDETKRLQDDLLLQVKDKLEWLYICGSGDPFGSRLYRELLCSMDRDYYPGKLYLHTNANLLDEGMWQRMYKINEAVKWVHVSIDAATRETYTLNRRGGNWDKLQANLKFISALRSNGPIETFEISFVVQSNNWREMSDFVQMGINLGVDRVLFNPIDDWGRGLIYQEKAVHLQDHPEHKQFVRSLANPAFYRKDVDLGLLSQLRRILL